MGVDINAKHINWCQLNLGPPFFFATTTTAPHLPFEDGYFDLIYSGSVFTHISDLADAWLLELRRIVRKGGYLYITIHDKRTVEVLLTVQGPSALYRVRRAGPILLRANGSPLAELRLLHNSGGPDLSGVLQRGLPGAEVVAVGRGPLNYPRGSLPSGGSRAS